VAEAIAAPELSLPEGRSASAEEDARGEPLYRRFFQTFNGTSVALVLGICFMLVLTSQLKQLPLMSLHEWAVRLVYVARQHLVSGLLALAAVALGAALLPERAPGRVRWPAMLALLTVSSAISPGVQLALSQEPFSIREAVSWCSWVVTLWTALGLMAYGLATSIRCQTAARRRLVGQIAEQNALSAAAMEARLNVLQAQIEPHFLFNTLANVRRLFEVDPESGQRMLGSLLDYLRAALPAMRRSSSALGEEFELVRAYLAVLQHRMGDRLRFRIELSDQLADATIPPLILPTLVENAVRHGLAPLPEGGTVTVTAARDGEQVVVRVADDGAGFQAASGSGVGLANTRARLSALFGSAARLSLCANEPRGVIAEVRLPCSIASASR
jgi:signal transduction histidine kinase